MTDTTFTGQTFTPATRTAPEALLASLFMATPLYIFATALKSALQASQR